MARPATAHAASAPAPGPQGPRADFNGDGYPDLAFAAPGATVKGFKGAGYVGVAYGSRNGVKDSAKKVFTQASAGVPGTPEAGDAFGSSITSADLDRDGYADLIVGSPGERIGPAEVAGGGATVLWGGPGGLAGGSTLLSGEEYDDLGRGLAVGDFNGDGYGEIAVGVPGEDQGTVVNAGGTVVLPGTATGPRGKGSYGFNQGTPEVVGAVEKDDRFGGAVSLRDLNGDGRTELAVGAPGENAGAGALWVFPAAASGPAAKGSFSFGHGTLGTVATKAGLGAAFNR
ncbi:FG-GAP and VCBS repeat-containing protein [Streptomyces sp. NPDC006906]|uniref:FG-GAP and VCBS repeat-containing protein n=1 Tax=unclassified Streptomyces TaxID=2593676 RepID=UPI0034044B9D